MGDLHHERAQRAALNPLLDHLKVNNKRVSPGTVETEHPSDEYEGLDENVRECLRDMTKPDARTTWMGWFPNSFSKLLNIPAKIAQELALQIRNVITQGMDGIWRERNTAQNQPKVRKESNAKIQRAYEKRKNS